jgi:hypothetical protein
MVRNSCTVSPRTLLKSLSEETRARVVETNTKTDILTYFFRAAKIIPHFSFLRACFS